jgi:hypothetical protein
MVEQPCEPSCRRPIPSRGRRRWCRWARRGRIGWLAPLWRAVTTPVRALRRAGPAVQRARAMTKARSTRRCCSDAAQLATTTQRRPRLQEPRACRCHRRGPGVAGWAVSCWTSASVRGRGGLGISTGAGSQLRRPRRCAHSAAVELGQIEGRGREASLRVGRERWASVSRVGAAASKIRRISRDLRARCLIAFVFFSVSASFQALSTGLFWFNLNLPDTLQLVCGRHAVAPYSCCHHPAFVGQLDEDSV